jgi:hypothetical protein
MKTLIETSIKIIGVNPTKTKTIFNSTENKHPDYLNVKTICGRTLRVKFLYDVDAIKDVIGSFVLSIPSGLEEIEVKDFIISEINSHLGN